MKQILILFTIISLSSCGALLQLTKEKSTIKTINKTTIELNGVLGKQMHKKLVKYIDNNPSLKKIILNQVPGSINDEWNVKTCLMVHENEIETYLTSSSIIASGGVDLFISGTKRTIETGAQIGVHSWSDGKKDGAEYPRESEENDLFIDFFNQIDMDTAFYWYTLEAAKAESIYWMTGAEINRFNMRKY